VIGFWVVLVLAMVNSGRTIADRLSKCWCYEKPPDSQLYRLNNIVLVRQRA